MSISINIVSDSLISTVKKAIYLIYSKCVCRLPVKLFFTMGEYFPDSDARSYASNGHLITSSSRNLTSADTTTFPLEFDISGVENVRYAYITIGSLTFFSLILFIVAYLRARDEGRDISSGTASQSLKGATDLKAKETNVSDQKADHSTSGPESRSGDTPIGDDSKRRDR
jgi:hypothetical protein